MRYEPSTPVTLRFRALLRYLAFTLALPVLVASAEAQTLSYGQEISLQSDHGRFLVAEPDGSLDANRGEQGPWERFRLLPVAGAGSRPRFGDQVALRSAHGRYVVAEADGSARADRLIVGSWERWTLVDPRDPSSRAVIRPRDLVALRSSHGGFLVAELDGRANADRPHLGPWEEWRIGRHWTDFYYDEGTQCAPGQCCPCPYRGRFDGANCFVARPPVGSPARIPGGEFVYPPQAGNRCPLGIFDGRVCRVGDNPASPAPFLFRNGFYLSALCAPDGPLQVTVERVSHCGGLSGPPLCSHRLTRDEFRTWPEAAVPRAIQLNTQIGVVFEPVGGPARRVALLFAGQQLEPPFGTGNGNWITGQPGGFNDGWGFRQPSRRFTLRPGSIANRLVTESIVEPGEDFLAVAFDARFNHKFHPENKDRIEDAYYHWLLGRIDPQTVELVYLAGHSRGGCLAMRLARRIQEEFPDIPVVGQSFDGVCNRNQGELGIGIPGRVTNPLVPDGGAYAWPTDLRDELSNHTRSLALLQIVGGHPFLPGDLAVRPFSQKRADQPELDLCWYRQRWVDASHDELGGPAIVQPGLDHLRESLDRFAAGEQCPAVGRCVKDPLVIAPFECNDLAPADCASQTECALESECRLANPLRPLTCRDLPSQEVCDRYGDECRWSRSRDQCRSRNRPFRFFECNDLTPADCGDFGKCRAQNRCRLQSGSLTCGDLFEEATCNRYTRWCDWI